MYNRPEEIDELLASILSQEYDEAFDVCIIEDGSVSYTHLTLPTNREV